MGDALSVLPVSLTVALVCLGRRAATVRSFTSEEDAIAIDRDFNRARERGTSCRVRGVIRRGRESRGALCGFSNARGKTQLRVSSRSSGDRVGEPCGERVTYVPLATLAAILLFIASRLVRWLT